MQEEKMEPFARRRRSAPARTSRSEINDSQRTRILLAMTAEAAQHGPQAATVTRVTARAGVSRRTFYELFADRGECLLAAVEQAAGTAAQRAIAAIDPRAPWANRMRAGLHALLELLDEQPTLAHLCVVQATAAGPAVLARRAELLEVLAGTVDGGRATARYQPPALTAQGVVGGVLGVIRSRLLDPQSDPQPTQLVELLGPLMSSIVLPYLGTHAARRELLRPLPHARAGSTSRVPGDVRGLDLRLTYRTVSVLAAIAAQPGLTNAQIASCPSVMHQGQISTLLARLARLKLIRRSEQARHKGARNAWRLTQRGEAVMRTIKHERLPRSADAFVTQLPWTA
jgi:AcrR family transcriptional regulator/DNA-binding MarR family transcriptional regulator